jgi:hypothetical protein
MTLLLRVAFSKTQKATSIKRMEISGDRAAIGLVVA